MKTEVIFSGIGGQGLQKGSMILAEAAVSEGKEVTRPSSYGGEVTGGFSESEIIISDEPIDFPGVLTPDIFITFSQEGYDRWISKLTKTSQVFFDPDLVKTIQPAKAVHLAVPATRIAAKLGSKLAANMVILGVVIEMTGLVSYNNLSKVIKEKTGDFAELNLKAVNEGIKFSQKQQKG